MTEPKKYRKKPVVIEAMQWTGDNKDALAQWTDGAFWTVCPEDRADNPDHTGCLYVGANSAHLGISTGEWVLRDAKGFYPCKPDVFAATYEAVES